MRNRFFGWKRILCCILFLVGVDDVGVGEEERDEESEGERIDRGDDDEDEDDGMASFLWFCWFAFSFLISSSAVVFRVNCLMGSVRS